MQTDFQVTVSADIGLFDSDSLFQQTNQYYNNKLQIYMA